MLRPALSSASKVLERTEEVPLGVLKDEVERWLPFARAFFSDPG